MRLALQRQDRHLASIRGGKFRGAINATAMNAPEPQTESSSGPLGVAFVATAALMPSVGTTATTALAAAVENVDTVVEKKNRVLEVLRKGSTFRAAASKLANMLGFNPQQRAEVGLPPKTRASRSV